MINFFNSDEDFLAFTYAWPITYAIPASFASKRSLSSFLMSVPMSTLMSALMSLPLWGISNWTCLLRPGRPMDVTSSADCNGQKIVWIIFFMEIVLMPTYISRHQNKSSSSVSMRIDRKMMQIFDFKSCLWDRLPQWSSCTTAELCMKSSKEG